jgi:dienelactone hydrolase
MATIDERINDWPRFTFEDGEFSFPVYKRTPQGVDKPPAIIVMHEVPGIYPAVIDFAERLVQEGYCVYMPHCWGSPANITASPMWLVRLPRPVSAGSSRCWR